MSYLDDIDISTPEFVDLYDELSLWSAPFGLMMLEHVPMHPGMTVLDVGAGAGFLSIELAQRCGAGTKVIAVDPWEAAMARLRHKCEGLGLGNVELRVQDAETLDLADASVDLIVSNLGINNFENADAVLANCLRMTKPGGSLFLTTNLIGHMAEFYEVFRDTLAELGRTERFPALDANIAHRGTVESVSALLREAGFEIAKAVTGSFLMRFANGSALLRHHFIRAGFLPDWKAVVGPERPRETFDALERNLDARAKQRGGLSLTIPMALIEGRRP
jgi:arsenite methyltransferase